MMKTRKLFIIIAIALIAALICGGGYFYVQNENAKVAAEQVLQQEQEAAEKAAAEKAAAEKAAAEKAAADKAAADKAAADKAAAEKAAAEKEAAKKVAAKKVAADKAAAEKAVDTKPTAPSSSEVAESTSSAFDEESDPTSQDFDGGIMGELIREGQNPGHIVYDGDENGNIDANEFFGIPADEPIIIDENMP